MVIEAIGPAARGIAAVGFFFLPAGFFAAFFAGFLPAPFFWVTEVFFATEILPRVGSAILDIRIEDGGAEPRSASVDVQSQTAPGIETRIRAAFMGVASQPCLELPIQLGRGHLSDQ